MRTQLEMCVGSVAEWEYRAWWLGFVLLSVAMCCMSGLFLAYPKWIVEPDWVSSSRLRHLQRLQRVLDWQKEDRRRRREERKRARQQRRRQRNASSNSYQLTGPDDGVNGERPRRPSDSSSMASSAMTSLAGATDRQMSVPRSSALSSAVTDVTDLSSTHTDKLDADWDTDDVLAADDDDDVEPWSKAPTCYSNRLFSIDEEDADSSTADNGAVSPAVKVVQWSLDDVQLDVDDQPRPAAVASVVTSQSSKQTVFEKKFRELRHVVTMPVYSLSVVASVFAAFLLAGYHTNAARFAQLQYGYDYQHAWFYTSGLCVGLAETIGPVVGGVIIHKRRLSRRQQLTLIIAMLIISSLLLLLPFAFNCSDAGFVWQNTTIT